MSNWEDKARIIDVSHWQNPDDMDWKLAIANGVVGVIIKYTQGTTSTDPKAVLHAYDAYSASIEYNNENKINEPILLGAYHFGDSSDTVLQARHFLDTVNAGFNNNLNGVLLMLDAEQNKPQMSVTQAELFVNEIYKSIGRYPWLYMGRSGPDGTGKGLPSKILSNCPLLMPAYGNHTLDLANILPKGWVKPSINDNKSTKGVIRAWQFTDGTINGSAFPGLGKVDQSKIIGINSYDELKAIWAV